MSEFTDTGVIHGRFQIFHNDHLKYLMAGKALCRTLVVGITNPDPRLTKKERSDPDRDDPVANPLSFFERHLLVAAALKESGVSSDEFIIVPFPVNLPEMYHHYVPMNALFFLTIYDDWGRRKLDYFRSLGLRTHVLWEVPPDKKGISAGNIRSRMAAGRAWTQLVPPAVASLLKKWDIPGRLTTMISAGNNPGT